MVHVKIQYTELFYQITKNLFVNILQKKKIFLILKFNHQILK